MGGNYHRTKDEKGRFVIVEAPPEPEAISLDQPADVSFGKRAILVCDLCERRFVIERTAASHFRRMHSNRQQPAEDWKDYFSPASD